MSFDICLKNQTGESHQYNKVGEISIPLADKSGSGIYSARHNVTFNGTENLTITGGESCAYGIDYIAVISTSESLSSENIFARINGVDIILSNNDYVGASIEKNGESLWIIRIPGEMIDGDTDSSVNV